MGYAKFPSIPLTRRLKGYNRLTHNMSEETTQVEQITREPSVKTKVKDPKRVQAGKTLSEKNKRAREALKREEEREKKKGKRGKGKRVKRKRRRVVLLVEGVIGYQNICHPKLLF